MQTLNRRAGSTLADLIISLSILGIVLGIAAPRLGALRASVAVRSARDAAASTLERARSLAVSRGTARVIIDPANGTIATESPVGTAAGHPLRIGDSHGVILSVGATAAPVTIEFNAMGLGIVASRTITFRRGNAQARLSVSSYGRVRRW